MRASRSLQLYSIFFILLTTFTAAWPWPRWLPERDSLIVVRQDNKSSDTAKATTTSTQDSASPSSTDNKSSDSNSNTDSGTITASPIDSKSATGTNSGSKQTGSITTGPTKSGSESSSKAATHTSYDASYAAGGVSLMTPAISSGSMYYKIGSNVTFGWNYTSLLATPTAVNIMATCTANSQLYTIATNQTVANATGLVVWDTEGYQATAVSDPLLTQTYTLIIYDAASSISATAEPGYLAVYDQYTFGMYEKQQYTDLSGWICATCSAGFGENERRALGLMVGMAVLTVLSFTWFVNGLGVVW